MYKIKVITPKFTKFNDSNSKNKTEIILHALQTMINLVESGNSQIINSFKITKKRMINK